MRRSDNKTREPNVSYTNCIVGSPSHEFIINAFYDEGAELVAVILFSRTCIWLAVDSWGPKLCKTSVQICNLKNWTSVTMK